MRVNLPRALTPFHPIPEIIGHTGVCGTWLFYAPAQDLYFAGGVSQITAPAVPFRFVPNQLRLLAR
jgi:CubicO group peptidase (beta-lactamase class C family)